MALETRRNIVPLMLEGFDFGTAAVFERLTGTLAPLKRYNGVPIVASYFEELPLTPDPGFSIVLNSLDVGARFSPAVIQTVRVLDESFQLLWEASPIPAPAFGQLVRLAPNVVLSGTIHLQFGTGDFGIANVDFD